ncbi:MAG: PDZ domain-containing protein [Candidatus Eisenbacteria bacterium]|nr:PDZ domain-containing protein [Candidatus Eisenbacteria bacterium]
MMCRKLRVAALVMPVLALLAVPSFAQSDGTVVLETPEKGRGETLVITAEEVDGTMYVQAAPAKDEHTRKEIKVVKAGESHAWLGVGIQELDADMMEALDLDEDVEGILINEIYEDSPAEAAGLMKGDVILTFAGEKATDVTALVKTVRDRKPGESVEVTVLRDGVETTLIATLGEREAEEMVWINPIDMGEISLEFLEALNEMKIPEIELGIAGLARRGKLGVYVEDIGGGLAEYFEVPDGKGVLVEDVVEDGPADKAGIKAGDVIIRIGDERVTNTATLVKAIAGTESGEPTPIGIVRKGREMEVTATIEHPEVTGEELRHKLMMMQGATDEHTRQLMLQDLSEEQREMLEEELEKLKDELEELKEELREMRNRD